MAQPLMPKATAVWLIDNTVLTFDQIADFCGLHSLEVQALADGDVGSRIHGSNPIAQNELSEEEIKRCEGDTKLRLVAKTSNLPQPKKRSKGPKYTPVSKRGDKPDAIAFLLKNHSVLSDAQIVKLVGTTKNTINAVRDRTHANTANIKAKDPVTLGLCSQTELNAAVAKANKKAGIVPEETPTNSGNEPMAQDSVLASKPEASESPVDAGMEALAAEAANFSNRKDKDAQNNG